LYIYRPHEKILDVKGPKTMLCKCLYLLSLLGASLGVASCGGLGGSINQGNPSGTLVATGTMTGSATAQVSVYSQGGNVFAVQLASLTYSGNCGAGANVGVVSGAFVSGPPLTSTSGTTNYSFSSLSSTPTEVFIYCNGSNPISSGIVGSTPNLNPA
jgi:hypothetical protein